jgi:hypothetical protein
VGFEFAMNYSFWPWRFVTLFAPDFFGNPAKGDFQGYGAFWEDHIYTGLLPVLLALGAGIAAFSAVLRIAKMEGKKERQGGLAPLLAGVTALSFLLALGKNTPVFPWLYQHAPTFDMFQAPTRFTLWAEFALALLAAIGADRWRAPQGRGLYWTRLGTAGALAISIGVGLALLFFSGIRPAFLRARPSCAPWPWPACSAPGRGRWPCWLHRRGKPAREDAGGRRRSSGSS